MRNNGNKGQASVPAQEQTKRRPGRRPMTAQEKEAAARVRAEEKEKANNLMPELFLQYQDCDTDMAALVEAAKADFHKTRKRTLVTALRLYIKPEERTAYYVINGDQTGKIPF